MSSSTDTPTLEQIHVGILTVSDRCSRGDAVDTSGPGLALAVGELFSAAWIVSEQECVPDTVDDIQRVLLDWTDQKGLDVVLTTGGTGLAQRDVTPEATKTVLEKEAPGLVHRMMSESLKVTPLAMLSRLTAGSRKKTLIVNLPGSKKGARECLSFLVAGLPHAVDLLSGRVRKVDKTHTELQKQPIGGGCGHHGNNHGHHGHTHGHHHGHPHGHQHDKHHGHPHGHHGHQGHQHDHGFAVTTLAGRDRQTSWPMITVKEAQEIVLRNCDVIGTETVSFDDSLGRVLAEDVYARDPLPPFRASVMDGYAVVSSDGPGIRPVLGGSNAGSNPDQQLQPGQIVRINTGAPVPSGADAVVKVEDTKLVKANEDGSVELEVEILATPAPGEFIRQVGSDIPAGSLVLKRHSVLGPAELGLLATVGAVQVQVFRRPVVSLLSTGNELQDPKDGELRPGAIRDSNKTTLKALLREQSVPIYDCGTAIDESEPLLAKLKEGLAHGDVLVTTGGVSMGDRDILRKVLVNELKADVLFACVRMRPGKPTTFATLTYEGKKKLVLGLPGNPVSATVTSHLYVLPACRKLSGHAQTLPAVVRARLNRDVRLDPRPEYQRVVLTWKAGESVAVAEDTGNQISSRLLSFSAANALLRLPPRTEEQTHLSAGTQVDALIIGDLKAAF